MLRYATDCSRIRRETRRVTRCVGAEFVIHTYARIRLHIYARPIFHPISVQDSDVVDDGKKGGRNTTDQKGSWKADRIRRYCSFESEYHGDSFSSLFPSFPAFSPSLFPSSYSFRSLSESERSTFFSSFLSFPRTLPGTYAVCKSRRECISVRITNRKRFSYLPFIKRNEHVRIDIRPISVYLGAPALSRYLRGTRFLHQYSGPSRSSFTCA